MNINELKSYIIKIINENYLNEMIYDDVKTDYIEKSSYYGDDVGSIFYFKTKNNNNYYLVFNIFYENPKNIICNKNKLFDYLKNNLKYENIDELIKTAHITFGYDKDNNFDINNTNDEIIKATQMLTNKNEHFDLFGRILYLINIFKNKNSDIDIYVGASNDNRKILFYKDIFKNRFSNEYTLFECENEELYPTENNKKYNTFYFVNKKTLK